ncbi:MAG: glycosyltransferase family 2 protein [Bacteroidetes bacterium]|nr:glycosyltransferase family 2 protein [Bacteroidota bacterium]
MKVSGFTFIRNAEKYDYPIVEAITSILPVCDEFIVCVGNSDDNTEALIQNIDSPKIKIIHSVWDDSLRTGGQVLAIETNKAFDAISPDSDWAFYIQGDECVHEKYLSTIVKEMQDNLNNPKIECLVFSYLHFYGNYHYTANSRGWYRREMRIIRNDKTIRSYRDAQGFRRDNKHLKGKLIDATIYHYGWVKNPYFQTQKRAGFTALYTEDNTVITKIKQEELFDYSKIDNLEEFSGSHPQTMQKRISAQDWDFEFDMSKRKLSTKDRILRFIEKVTGKRLFEFRNYDLV